ncbi:MAG TPA: o-succinylbenzoate synthase [Anaerolineales bacterium]|nr:o-succinylbenzoate synthase [Anaerolineales bacterium]
MILEAADLYHVRMRLRSPFETSFGVEHDRDAILLRLRADGVEGWGECVAGAFPGYSYETVGTAWHVLEAFFLPAVLGREFAAVEDVTRNLEVYRGHPLARAGLELAVWDVVGRSQGRPLASLLGGERKTVPVGVSVGLQADTEALLSAVEGYLADGYRRVKLKIKPGRDLDVVRPVRSAHPDLALQVDANSAYSLDDRAVFRAMDSLGLLLIEQPLAEDDLLDHASLQADLQTPLCLDESILSVRHARQALECGACRVINIKPARLGGLSEAVRVHDLCRARGIPVWCGGMLETGIGRASNLALASLPGFTLPGDISASDRYYADDIAWPRFTLNADSTIDVPREPGLGVEVDEGALRKVTVRAQAFKA